MPTAAGGAPRDGRSCGWDVEKSREARVTRHLRPPPSKRLIPRQDARTLVRGVYLLCGTRGTIGRPERSHEEEQDPRRRRRGVHGHGHPIRAGGGGVRGRRGDRHDERLRTRGLVRTRPAHPRRDAPGRIVGPRSVPRHPRAVVRADHHALGPQRGARPCPRARARRRRLRDQALLAARAGQPRQGAPAPERTAVRDRRRAPVADRRPAHRQRQPRGDIRRGAPAPDPDGVPHPRPAGEPPRASLFARSDTEPSVERRRSSATRVRWTCMSTTSARRSNPTPPTRPTC